MRDNTTNRYGLSDLAGDLLLWAFALGFIWFHVGEVLEDRALAGWDLVPHYTLYVDLLGYLKHGALAGYNQFALTGYPEFTLYPPLGYLFLALPHLLSTGSISEQLSFNVMLAALPVLFLIALHDTARVFFDRTTARWAVLLGTIFLASPPAFGLAGMGLTSIFGTGLIVSFQGLVLFVVLLGVLERIRTGRSGALLATACLTSVSTLLALTHLLTAVLAAALAGWYLCATPGLRGRLIMLLSGGISLGLSWWWFGPFLNALPLSSSSTVGLWGQFADPLLYIFPGLNPARFISLWENRGLSIFLHPLATILPAAARWEVPAWVAYFPFAGAVLLGGFIVGVRRAIVTEQLFLLTLTLVSLLLVPRSLLTDGTDSGLHFYRYIPAIAVMMILVAASGVSWAMRGLLQSLSFRSSFAIFSFITLLSWSLVAHNFVIFSINGASALPPGKFHQYENSSLLFSDSYPQYRAANELIAFVEGLSPVGRVAVESVVQDYWRLGSPHYFNARLGLSGRVATAGGLLLESTPVAPLLMPTLFASSKHVQWGERGVLEIPQFLAQTPSDRINRLRAYSVQYIVAASPEFSRVLISMPDEDVRPLKSFGPYALFEVTKHRALAFETNTKPFLFVGETAEFRGLARTWLLEPELLGYPVLFSTKGDQLAFADKDKFAGIIVAPRIPETTKVGALKVLSDTWRLPVVAIGKRDGSANGVRWIEFDSEDRVAKQLLFHVKSISGALTTDSRDREEVSVEARLVDNRLTFSAHGLVGTTYGFAPGWSSSLPAQRIYLSNLGTMYMFAHGDTELTYEPSGY